MLNELFNQDTLLKLLEPTITKIVDLKVEERLLQLSKINEEDSYLSRQEAQYYLKMSYGTIHKYTKDGTLKSKRVGKKHLYKKSDLQLLNNKKDAI